MVLVYCEQTSSRLEYILNEVLAVRCGLEYAIETDIQSFTRFAGAKINYSMKPIPEAITIKPIRMLWEPGISVQHYSYLGLDDWNRLWDIRDSEIPFDVFAASFYLLTRYEEYLPNTTDVHGRYRHENSAAYKLSFLNIPLVDRWAHRLRDMLVLRTPGLTPKHNQFRSLLTIDVDFLFRYQAVPFIQSTARVVKQLLSLRFSEVIQQLQVITQKSRDPFDTFDYVEQHATSNQMEWMYFWLMRSGTRYDKTNPTKYPRVQTTIQQCSKTGISGIHPSYHSAEKMDLLQQEKSKLEQIIGKPVRVSRQHYLRVTWPVTYRNLIAAGITDEYSMMYPNITGFRASTAYPFYFYDLIQNQPTALRIHAPCIMDTTLRYKMKQTNEQAQKDIEQLVNEIKSVGGTFIAIWHNSNLSEIDGWHEWKPVFERMCTFVAAKR